MLIFELLRYLPNSQEQAKTTRRMAEEIANDNNDYDNIDNLIRNLERALKKYAGQLNILKIERQNVNHWFWDHPSFFENRPQNLNLQIIYKIGQLTEKNLFPKPSLIETVYNDLLTPGINNADRLNAENFWLTRIFYSESTLRFQTISYDTDLLTKVIKAINRSKTVSIEVLTRRNAGKVRQFENVQFIALLQHGVNTDLIFIKNGNPVAKYRVQLHRITNITINNESHYVDFDFQSWTDKTGGLFNDPADGHLDEYVKCEDAGRLFNPKKITLIAYIHNDLQEELKFTKIESNQIIKKSEERFSDDGLPWYQLEVTTQWSEQLTWWVMSWAQRIIVKEPHDLRKLIKSRLSEAVLNYEK